jgi:uncharacterized protein YegP (UPF0339 family)
MENVEIFKSDSGEYYFRIKAANGLVVAQSEGYKDKRNAINGIEAVAKAFAPPPTDPADPDAPPAIAFAKRYAPMLAKWQAGLSSVATQRNEMTLVEIVLKAMNDGWVVAPPSDPPDYTDLPTGSQPIVEPAPEEAPKEAPKTRGRRKAGTA